MGHLFLVCLPRALMLLTRGTEEAVRECECISMCDGSAGSEYLLSTQHRAPWSPTELVHRLKCCMYCIVCCWSWAVSGVLVLEYSEEFLFYTILWCYKLPSRVMAAAAAAPLFTLLSINQPQAGARPQTWLNKDKDSSSLQAQKYFKQKNKYSVSFELFITYVEQ